MGLMVQLIWQLVNLFTIALAASGSTGSIPEPPAISPSIKFLQLHQTDKEPLLFLSPGQTTSLPPDHALEGAAVPAQSRHDAAPPMTADEPHDLSLPIAKPPGDSVSPLSLPPLMVPLPLEPPPFLASAPLSSEPTSALAPPLATIPPDPETPLPLAEPPQAVNLPPLDAPPFSFSPPPDSPPVPPNASPPLPQQVPSHASPPDFLAHSHALVPPPLMAPLPPEPPPIITSPLPAPPHAPAMPSPTSKASSPLPQLFPPIPSPLNFTKPSHTFVSPPMLLPLPQEPPPIFSSSPPIMPPVLPNASSPLPQMVPSPPSSPDLVGPPHALVPPPLMEPFPQEPPPIFPSPPLMPPIASSPPPQMVPSHPSPPNFIALSPALLPPPSMEPLPSKPPPILLSPPPAAMPFPPAPPHASSPPVQLVPSHALAPPPSVMPLPKEPPSVFPSIPPTTPPTQSPPMPPHESSPFPHLVPPQASPPASSIPPPLTRPPHVFSTPPPVELPHVFPPPSITLRGATPPHVSSPSTMSPPLIIPSPPFESSHSYAPQSPSHASQRKETQSGAPPPVPTSLEPSPASRISPRAAPSVKQLPRSHPPISRQIEAPNHGAPFQRSNVSEPRLPPLSSPASSKNTSSSGVPIGAPPGRAPSQLPTANVSSHHGSVTDIAPAPFSSQVHPPTIGSHYSPYPSPAKGPSSLAPMPAALSPKSSTSEGSHSYAVSPSPLIHKYPKNEVRSPGPASVLVPPPAPSHQGQAESPSPLYAPKPSRVAGQKYNLSSPPSQGSPVAMVSSPSPSQVPEISPVPSKIPFLSPKISPSGSSTRNTKRPLAPPIHALPPPPPNQDCAYLTCTEPFTNTPPGSPCGCVWPMQVGLRLSVPLYIFFPLVTELAGEIASGVFMKPSQVRVMGANATSQEPEKTIVLVDLVPLNDKFDNGTSMLTFQRFWHKQVAIDKSIFGDYDVLYVHYPGLPPSPPMAPSDIAVINGMPYSVGDPNGSNLHPLGVNIAEQRHKHKLTGSLIAVIIFSAIVCLLICGLVAWVLIFRHGNCDSQSAQTPCAIPSLARSSGPTGHSNGSGPSSPLSFGSSLAVYTGSAKTFSASEIEKATDNFNPSGVLGEGGFGCVYHGILEDGPSVAVKVLKRDDQQGGREFLAEVEMLSRLHHRNLIKLIGICIEERMRCLVYELVPNGSVDSHLHGADKETAPLDWPSRLKIALGAARGLAYLHEDSSPRVIHRDFKSSNILLENDFTPKVSDFGLARTALDEENRYISTRVMGTFGYVAPEYAMTGHLLVKSDVYSYGVVLLELLTGRKPVDMSQPPGQENLVTWTRPFLATKEGLASIIDPSLGPDVPLENVAKVAAIASMCVQPEVSHRPFMGEVVQALKLVCDECDDSIKDDGEDSRSLSQRNLSMDFDAKVGPSPQETLGPVNGHDLEKGVSVSENFSVSGTDARQASGSFRRHSASGPVRTTRGPQFWQKIRRLSQGSVSEHGVMYRSWASSH